MVRRYSHKAMVTISEGNWIDGEWIQGTTEEIKVKGEYSPSASGQFKVNADGRELSLHGEFHTKAKRVKNATHIRIDNIALDVDIISWEQYQSHSVIYV